ncbi:terpene synthase family protein [Streptomyces iranensis]|uniref:terpene synthase family protein n=1 Tax=Streptomyces iranensis TaxID=576784 RepID=UPI0039B73758
MPVNDLGISSPGRIHPRVDQIGSRLEVWAVRTGLAGGAVQRARLRAAGFHRMAARMIPDAPAADVERLAQWITVLFHFDDEQDEGPMGRSETVVSDTYAALTAVIEGRPPHTRRASPPVITAVAGLWPATAFGMSQEWRHRFRDHLHRHRDAFLTQIAHRPHGTAPTAPHLTPEAASRCCSPST